MFRPPVSSMRGLGLEEPNEGVEGDVEDERRVALAHCENRANKASRLLHGPPFAVSISVMNSECDISHETFGLAVEYKMSPGFS